jgi:two-component system, cell cycle sensor histidine kinase and response regulator CckA
MGRLNPRSHSGAQSFCLGCGMRDEDKTRDQLLEELRRLRAGHNLLQAVIEGIPDAVYVKDLQGRYLMINSAGASLVGKAVEEVLGRDDTVLFVSESARHFGEMDRQVREGGKTETCEQSGTAAGVTRTYLTTKAPFRGPHGELLGVVGISGTSPSRRGPRRSCSDRKRSSRPFSITSP